MYEAVDLDLEIPVALKVLRPEYAGQPSAEARFRREATTAARLRHPNIVFIRDVGEAEGTVFVAMDLLPLSLERRLEVFPRLPETEVVRFALEVAAALAIAHADGIVHRDIKPDNVMLGAHGEAIVADFGLAGAFAKDPEKNGLQADDPGKVMGTPHYFSPEQARGLDLDGRSDLYSLGVMMYRAATGTLPFEGNDWTSVARQHVEDTPVPPRMLVPELTEGFDAIVLRLMAKKPEQRFASATQLADSLLTLPTAPTAHSVGLTPSSASITQVAFPYLHSGPGRSWRRTAVLGTMAIVVIAAIAMFLKPSLAGLPADVFSNAELPLTTPVKLDSTPITKADSTPTQNVATVLQPTAAKPPAKAASGPRKSSKPESVYVSVTATDSTALLTVDRQQKGYRHWAGLVPAGREVKFIARLENPIPGCPSRQQEITRTYTDEKTAEINLEVARCSVFLFSVKSTNSADYLITGHDFKFERPFKYEGTPTPIVLRNGRYKMTVHAEKCTDYNIDTLMVGIDSATKADTLRRTAIMTCQSDLTKK